MMNLKLLVPVLLAFSLLASSQWISQSSGTNLSLLDVDFVSQTTGYAVGGPYIGSPRFPEGVFLKTINSGETWSLLTPPGDHQLSGVCFINSTYGWAVGESHIYKTINSGETWTEQTYEVDLIGNARGFFHAIECIDANTAYAVSFNGVIVKTENGLTWTQKHGNWNASSEGLFDISCVDRDACWAVGNQGEVLYTVNGGANWTNQDAYSNVGFYAVQFLDRSNGFVAGDNARIRRTINSVDWTNQTTAGTYETLRGIYFVNSTYGWAVGNNVIRFTNNSGENWYSQTTDIDRYGAVPVILRGIDFSAENFGWAVGDNGTILRYGELTEGASGDVPGEETPAETPAETPTSTEIPSETPSCPPVSLIFPQCELPSTPFPTWDNETGCPGEYVCQAPTTSNACQVELDACLAEVNQEMMTCLSNATTTECDPLRQEGVAECDTDYAVCLTNLQAPPGENGNQSAPAQSQNPLQLVTSALQGVVTWLANLFGLQ